MSDDLEEVKNIIPHREPFLFIDRIIERGEGCIVTEREVRADEPQFEGHYPGSPLMPGVLLCEACFQTGAILLAGDVVRTSSQHIDWGILPQSNEQVKIHWRGRLPHWEKEEGLYFVTWRLADSIPELKREKIAFEREDILLNARLQSRDLSASECYRLDRLYSERIEELLNAGYGECYFNNPACAEIVQNALKHFDGERYRLHSWVVMPNHVHVMFKVKPNYELSSILQSWKSFTAKQCNKVLGRTGTFWMEESYDRLVRNSGEFERFGSYILENPAKAGLDKWEWVGLSGGRMPPDSADRMSAPPKKPVLTRILEAKFRGMVVPGDVMRIEVSLDEKMGEAFVMSGKVLVNSKVVLRVKFIVAMVELADK